MLRSTMVLPRGPRTSQISNIPELLESHMQMHVDPTRSSSKVSISCFDLLDVLLKCDAKDMIAAIDRSFEPDHRY